MADSIKRIYGIDLGTTYSCIAYIRDDGSPEVIKNKEGELTTPSVVLFEDGNRVVGKEAKNMAVSAPNQVVQGIKYHMGDPDYFFEYQGTDYRAEEISSYILRKLVEDAQEAMGEEIKDVVITCPAYFGANQREATAAAGKIAGLNVHAILNEPTAAALAYSQKLAENEIVLVFDLGGGTFDITMIEVKPEGGEVIVTGGDHNLGGLLWDQAIVKYLARQFMEITGTEEDPFDDDETRQDLLIKAENAKRTLSSMKQATVMVTHAGKREKVTLTREKFDEITANLLENTIMLTRDMLVEAEKKGYTSYRKILLVGGSTRMLQVKERVQQEFGVEPEIFDPDESVAKGAALYGLIVQTINKVNKKLEDKNTTKDDSKAVEKAAEEVAAESGMTIGAVKKFYKQKFVNVTSRSYGIQAIDEEKHLAVSNLIRKNTKLPVSVSQRFGTEVDNQETLEIRIMENLSSDERVEISDSTEIGLAILEVPNGLPARSPIDISFDLNEQGRLLMVATEPKSKKEVKTEVQTQSVISQEEIEEAVKRSTMITINNN